MATKTRMTAIGETSADVVYKGYACFDLGVNGWTANRFAITFRAKTFEGIASQIDARMLRLYGC